MMPEAENDLSLSEVLETAPPLARSLQAGARGHDVARLQLELKRGGIDPGPHDGIFGAKTERAVEAFRSKHGPAGEGAVDDALFAAVLRVAALDRIEDLKRAAGELEGLAAERRTRADALEDEAATHRGEDRPDEAAARMEEAAETWLEGAEEWTAAAELWLEAAHHGEPHGVDDGWKSYARWARATDAARLYAGRARTAFGKAGEDLDAAGGTDHAERIATARAEARALSAR